MRKFNTKEEFADWFRRRTKKFAIDVIKFCKGLPQNTASRAISYQIIKSSTSVADNYRAVCRARSGKEFYAKLCITVEEANESEFWMDMIIGAELEILKIVSTARKNAGGKNKE